MFVIALRIGFSYFIRIYPGYNIAFCCLVHDFETSHVSGS